MQRHVSVVHVVMGWSWVSLSTLPPHLCGPAAVLLQMKLPASLLGPYSHMPTASGWGWPPPSVPPPPAPGVSFQPRGGNLSFYRPQTVWLDCGGVTLLPFADYDDGMRAVIVALAGERQTGELPLINGSVVPVPELDSQAATAVCNYYASDLPGYS